MYFVVLGALTFFGGVLTGSIPPLLWFALFVGVGALAGLALGLLVAVAMALLLPWVNRGGGDQTVRLRWAGAVAGGLPVFLVTLTALLGGWLGPLDADVTTVVVVPVAVAAIGSAAAAPGLCSRYQPKRPEM